MFALFLTGWRGKNKKLQQSTWNAVASKPAGRRQNLNKGKQTQIYCPKISSATAHFQCDRMDEHNINTLSGLYESEPHNLVKAIE